MLQVRVCGPSESDGLLSRHVIARDNPESCYAQPTCGEAKTDTVMRGENLEAPYVNLSLILRVQHRAHLRAGLFNIFLREHSSLIGATSEPLIL